MNPIIIGIVVGLGSVIGLLIDFPGAHPYGLAIFFLFNAMFATLASAVVIPLVEALRHPLDR